LEESKKKKCDEVKAFSEDMMRRLELLEKEVQRVRDERVG
jgi:prefoldin subunit 5